MDGPEIPANLDCRRSCGSLISLARFCETVAERVDTAGTAPEAIVKLAAHVYGCIIIDCWLPNRDGVDLARWIRETPGQQNRHAAIVGISADIRYTLARCREAGMNTLVLKPYAPQTVVDLITSRA